MKIHEYQAKEILKKYGVAKGVILCKSIEEVREAAESLLGDVLVTIQTGEEGQLVQKIYVTDGVDIEKEFYLGILLDRAESKNVIMVSTGKLKKLQKRLPKKSLKNGLSRACRFR